MAPIILATMGELASRLTQEFGEKESQILKLEEENARLRALEVEHARLRELEGENARLRALLQAAAASSIPSTATAATLGVDSDSRGGTDERAPRRPGVTSARAKNRMPGRTERSTHQREHRSYIRDNSSSDDDEDPIPIPKPKKEKAAAAGPTNKRKRAADSSSSSKLSETLKGLAVDGSYARSKRLPTRSNYTADQQSEVPPRKRPRPTPASPSGSKQNPANTVQTPSKKRTVPPHPYTPLQESPFKHLTHPTPPSAPSAPSAPPPKPKRLPSTFRFPASSSSSSNAIGTNQPTAKPNEPTPTPSKQTPTPTYAETPPFTFKFISTYLTPPSASSEPPDFEFHDSASLANTMSSFWKTLASLRDKWEERAGAEWAWEVQKKFRVRGKGSGEFYYFKRVCVTSKLDNKPTRWRRGDAGFFACLDCAGAARPCFTWVRGEDAGGEEDGEGDGVFGAAPKGEFWCLPVHEGDRRCKNIEGREIRSWVNEGESSNDEDDSSEESEESGSGAADEYDDDDSGLTSGESSEESSEEDHGVVESDGEL